MKKITKLLALMFCIVMAVGVLTATASAAEVIYSGSGDTIKWELTSDGTLTISGTGKMGSFSELPDRPAAWRYAGIIENIKKVVICDGITSIGEFAFYECENLETVEIADSVTEIGRGAFMGCKLLTSAEIPEGVAAIASNAFAYCSSLKSVVLPEGLTEIGDSAFWYCKSLERINFPEGLETIDRNAFGYCTSLAEVNIPSSLKTIGYESDFDLAFPGCPISKITIDSANQHYSTDERGQVLFNKDKTVLLYAVKSLAGEYTVPATVRTIDYRAFTDCAKLTKVTLPEGLMEIIEDCFYGCMNLESVDIPESVTRIGFNAFYNCNSLKNIVIPEKVTGIPGSAFGNCSSLETITIPKALEDMDACVFTGCSSLKSFVVDPENEHFSVDERGALLNRDKTMLIAVPGGITGEYAIPGSVKTVYPRAIDECPNLTSVTVPASTTLSYEDDYPLGVENFGGCYNLRAIRVDPDNPYYTSDENGVLYSKDKSVLLLVPGGYEGTFTIPASVEEIDATAFADCSKLTGIVSESEYYCTDEHGVLYDAEKTGLIKAPVTLSGTYVLPDTATGFVKGAFLNCSSLEGIVLPSSSFFYDDSFKGCTALTRLIFRGDKSIFFPGSVNSLSDFEGTIFYPAKNHTWADISDSINSPDIALVSYGYSGGDPDGVLVQGTMENGINWAISTDGVLTVSGTGEVSFDTAEAYPWYPLRFAFNKVVIGEGITGVGFGAFSNNDHLVRVTLPAGFKTIGDEAFKDCPMLESVILPEGLTYIGNSAFSGDISIYRITLPSTLTYLGNSAFYSCESLSGTIIIPAGITEIYDSTFYNCHISYVVFPKGLTRIDLSAFQSCEKLDSIVLPTSLKAIGIRAFDGCTSLSSVVFLGDPPEINNEAFGNVTANAIIPVENENWTDDNTNSYGGALTWRRQNTLGDVNLDGQLTNSDLITVARYVVRLIDVFTPGYINVVRFGDMNADGNINNADIITLARAIVRL